MVTGISGLSAVVLEVACNQWSCPTCGRRKAAHFCGIARAGCDLAGERIRLLTISCPRESPASSWAALGPRWHRLSEALARRLGRRLTYFATVELQRRGNPHLHVLMRDSGYIPKPVVHALGYQAGFGFSDIRQIQPGAGVVYVTKYLTKAAGVRYPKGTRRVRMSRDWAPRSPQMACEWGEGWQWLSWDGCDAAWVSERLSRDGYQLVQLAEVQLAEAD